MSAFLNSGRSKRWKYQILTSAFGPQAVIHFPPNSPKGQNLSSTERRRLSAIKPFVPRNQFHDYNSQTVTGHTYGPPDQGPSHYKGPICSTQANACKHDYAENVACKMNPEGKAKAVSHAPRDAGDKENT